MDIRHIRQIAIVSLSEWLFSFFGEPVCRISVEREASGDSVDPATVEQTDTGVRFKTENGRQFEITVREVTDGWVTDSMGREIDMRQ